MVGAGSGRRTPPDLHGRHIPHTGGEGAAFPEEEWEAILGGDNPYSGHRQPGKPQIFGSVWTDITERKRVEKEVAYQYAFLRQVIDGNPNLIFVKDSDDRYLLANRATAETLGTTAEYMLWETDIELGVLPEECAKYRQDDIHILQSGKVKLIPEERYTWPSGEVHYYQTTKHPQLDEKGVTIGVLAVCVDITERKQAEENIRRSQEQLRGLTRRLQSVREEERRIIAREIHDELGQSLTALKMDLHWLKKRLPVETESLIEKIDSMSQLTDSTIQTVKRISSELRPPELDDFGLWAAIEWQANEFQERSGIKCKLRLQRERIVPEPEIQIALFRIFQEALTNIVRHASATQVSVLLKKKDGNVVLRVKDNGRGITQEQISAPGSLGLLGMKERAYACGGRFEIAGEPGRGTTVTVTIPLNRGEKADDQDTDSR